MTAADTALPSRTELRDAIPERCFKPSLSRSAAYAASSLLPGLILPILAALYLPTSVAWYPAWLAYFIVAGTFWCGVWVLGHECGHGAFAPSRRVNDAVGFAFHSALLVPYFSWQHSHALHHARTNHLDEGETHVPAIADSDPGRRRLRARAMLGDNAHSALVIFLKLFVGWPLYLLLGVTGGPVRGRTNHFWPWTQSAQRLFPSRYARRVAASTAGVLATIAALIALAVTTGSPWLIAAVYLGPYLVCHAWVVLYTWLQHTDENVAHFDGDQWDPISGAFATIDRRYAVVDVLHHRIGSTHVAHHLFPRIPHYHAQEATDAIRAVAGDLYRYSDEPIYRATWSAAKNCLVVDEADGAWWYRAEPVR